MKTLFLKIKNILCNRKNVTVKEQKRFNVNDLSDKERKEYYKRKNILLKSLDGIKEFVETIPDSFQRGSAQESLTKQDNCEPCSLKKD